MANSSYVYVTYIRSSQQKVWDALTKPEFQKHLAELGLSPIDGSPAQFQRVIDQDKVKWADVIKKSNLKLD